MSKEANELRAKALKENQLAKKSKSLSEGAEHRKRSAALRDMADNEDWLDGKNKGNK